MARYKQYCPIARASEIVADRWTPLIVRELLAGSRHFNEIERGLPESPGRCSWRVSGISRRMASSSVVWSRGLPASSMT